MDLRTVSIVIPTFNRSKFLSKAIDTALAQTVACEVIVVDHGSNDDTPALCRSYGERIVYLRHERDEGPIVCWLHGVIAAASEYIHITYDDDWIDPNFVQACMPYFATDVGLVFSNARIVYANRSDPNFDCDDAQLSSGLSEQLLDFLLRRPFSISPGCAIMRRSDSIIALMRNPMQDKVVYRGAGPDLMMFLYCLKKHPKFHFVKKELAFFRAHDSSITVNALKARDTATALAETYTRYKKFFLEGITT